MKKEGAVRNIEDVIIERYAPSDLDRIMEIELVSFTVPWSRESYEELSPLESIDFWVAKSGREVVGYTLFQHIMEEMELHTFAVDVNWRRRGVGRKLLNHMIGEAKKKGVLRIFLQVRPSNMNARVLYESLGFKPIGLRPNYYRDDGEAAIVMKLDLA